MSTPEGRMWVRIRPLLKGMHAVRIESHMEGGIPDVNYSLGWVELKCMKEWPKRPDTPLKIPHFTEKQRVWLTQRACAGGRAYLLLQVGPQYLLFLGHVAAAFIGSATKQELEELCLEHWPKKPTALSLLKWLKKK